MPRNASGTYTLPSGNPVVSGTVIESTWANSTLADLASAITDSLSRSGEGGMTAPLRVLDGTVSIPGLGFANETGSGLYRAAAGDVGLSVLGSRILRLQAAGASITGTLGVSGVATLTENPVLSAGTANGVPYLNGSKSLVSGSNLVFTGSLLGINKASPATSLDVGTSGADVLTSVFTTGVDDLNFRVGFMNGVAGSTGSLQGRVGLFYLGTGEAATIGFVRGGGATDSSLTFRTNGNEQVRVTSTGNVGIGTSTPAEKLDVRGTIKLTNTTNSANFGSLVDGGGLIIASGNNNPMYFYTGGTERARIDSSGNLLVGVTAPSAGGWTSQFNTPTSGAWPLALRSVNRGAVIRVTGAEGYAAYFERNDGAVATGYIYINSNNTTSYVTSSDYRLKENVQPMQGALEFVRRQRPVKYTWKADGSEGSGYIAHWMQEDGAGQCVTGEKDAVDADGNPQYQGIDTSFMVAPLNAAIIELADIVDQQQTLITDLRAEFDAYKAANNPVPKA